jgi:hypothetical protein
MSSLNIIQTENSPALNLIEQVNLVKDQVVANAEFDNHVNGFKDTEIKPVEKFSNYKNNKENTVSLMCLFAVIIAIICYLHRTR